MQLQENTVSDFIKNPLTVIDTLFEEQNNAQEFYQRVKSHAEQLFNTDEEHYQAIPLLASNTWSLQSSNVRVAQNSLVRVRCMVQDMFDPEYFNFKISIPDTRNGRKVVNCMFRDSVQWDTASEQQDDMQDAEIYEEPSNISERRILYCVGIPGETTWSRETLQTNMSGQTNLATPLSHRESSSNKKRNLSLSSDIDDGFNGIEDMENGTNDESNAASPKKAKVEDPNIQTTNISSSSDHHLSSTNLPWRIQDQLRCIVKMYDTDDGDDDSSAFRICDVVEFVGVLTLVNTEGDEQHMFDGILDEAEARARYPPHSLVPRLHCILYRKLDNLYPSTLPKSIDLSALQMDFVQTLPILREQLIQYISKPIGNDTLAAQYVLMNLLSRIYHRMGYVPLGQCNINLVGFVNGAGFISQDFETMIESLVPVCQSFDMSIDNLENVRILPKKNYETNTLECGFLQLANGTNFIVNEGALSAGQINEVGLHGLQAIQQLLAAQTVAYDFTYHTSQMEVDIAVIVLSEGKSIFSPVIDTIIPIDTNRSSQSTSSQSANHVPIQQFRLFIALAKYVLSAQYSISESMQKIIETDFTRSRKNNPQTVNSSSLHRWLVLARLLALSHGQMTLTEDVWQQMRNMESSRLERVKDLSQQQ